MNTEQGLAAAMSLIQQPPDSSTTVVSSAVGPQQPGYHFLPPPCEPGYIVMVMVGTKSMVPYSDWITWPASRSGSPWWFIHNNIKPTFRCEPSPATQVAPAFRSMQRQQRMRSLRGLGEIPMGDFSQTLAAASSMQDLELAAGLGAVFDSFDRGLGMLGPWAGQDVKIDAKTYEITGTEVALFEFNAKLPPKGTLINPSTPGVVAFFNTAYGANGGKVAGVPDQVDADGQVQNTGGRKWAHVTVSKAQNAGATDPEHPAASNVSPNQTGWAPVDYMADVGWTASHGGTGPIPQGKGGGGGGGKIEPAKEEKETVSEVDYTPWILGGAAVLGLGIIGWAVMAPKGKAGGRRRRSSRRLRRAYA